MFIFGDVFLRNFYSVYDMDEKAVYLAVDKEAEGSSFIGVRHLPIPDILMLVASTLACISIFALLVVRNRRRMQDRLQVKIRLLYSSSILHSHQTSSTMDSKITDAYEEGNSASANDKLMNNAEVSTVNMESQ